MPVLNYAELYQQALQQKFTSGLHFQHCYNTPNNKTIKFVNAKTIQIPRIDVTGMVDVNRDSIGTFGRKVDNSWETKTLAHDREFRTLVDPVDVDETNLAVTIANITNVFNTEQKIPEMDKYMISKMYSEFTGFGQVADATVLTTANILTVYDKLMEEMDEAEVPQEGRILYVTPAINTMLKNAQQLQRYLEVSGPDATGNINRSVRSLDDVMIQVVPSVRMKTAYDFTIGAIPAVGSKQINMCLCHQLSIIAPQKYEFVSLQEPSAVTGGKWLYYERLYWDAFLVERKVPGCKFNITA